MKKHVIVSVVLGLTMMASSFVTAFAENAYPVDQVIDPERTSTVTLNYQDEADGSAPVEGAEFTFYKVADIASDGKYASIIPMSDSDENEYLKPDENGRISFLLEDGQGQDASYCLAKSEAVLPFVKKAYETNLDGGYIVKAVTDNKGLLTAELTTGLYLAEETVPAKKHFASVPFLFSAPDVRTLEDGTQYWDYEIKAEPKSLPANSLVIQKTVKGSAGDASRAFTFVVTFSTDDVFHYRKSDGTEGDIKSGEAVTLKSGQEAVIEMIPVGVTYTVKEKEANADGYTTTMTGNEGTITRTEESVASFINTKNKQPGTPGKSSKPGKPVQTSDTPMLPIWAATGLMAAIVLILAMTVRSKRKETAK